MANVYQEDVYDTHGGSYAEFWKKAEAKGYQFCTDSLGRVFRTVGDGSGIYIISHIRDLPKAPERPTKRSEVYLVKRPQPAAAESFTKAWKDAIVQARKHGFRFISWAPCKDQNTRTLGYPIHNLADVITRLNNVYYEDLENDMTFDLRPSVAEYLLRPYRSKPDEIFRQLGEAHFWSETDYDKQCETIEGILSSQCETGVKSFRDYMGENLPDPNLKTIVLEISYATSQADMSDRVANLIGVKKVVVK